MNIESQGLQREWTSDGPNIFAPDVLERIKQALSESCIGGIHLYLGGGGSGDDVAFSKYEAFLSHVTDSRPGDLFILWSIAEMRRKGFLLLDSVYRDADPVVTGSSLFSPNDLDRVRGYLSQEKFNEVLSITSAGGERCEAVVTDLDGSRWDKFLDAARRAAVAGGAISVLPLTQIDSPEFYLVKAKRPNEKGQVPLGGAY